VRRDDRHERQRGEQDGRQAALDELFGPVNQAVVTREQQQAHPRDERPFGPAARIARAERAHHNGQHGSGDEEPQRRHVEGTQPAVSNLDHQPGGTPDDAQQRIQGNVHA
jgi:hypothetical protein